jgi:hypothetical protein
VSRADEFPGVVEIPARSRNKYLRQDRARWDSERS